MHSEWEQQTLSDILAVALQHHPQPHKHTLALPEDINMQQLDIILAERLAVNSQDKSQLMYLVRAAQTSLDKIKHNKYDQTQLDTLHTLNQRLARYAALVLHPDTELIELHAKKKCIRDLRVVLAQHGMQGRDLPTGFLANMISALEELSSDGVLQVFGQVVDGIIKAKTVQDLNLDNYQAAFRSIAALAQEPATAKLIVSHSEWIPQNVVFGRDLEYRSFFGRYFQLMAMQNGHEFENIRTKTRQDVEIGQRDIRAKLNALHEILHEACFALIRSEAFVKDRVLE
jgi:hypothetical protein